MTGRRPALRAVFFDWDGTLVDSAEASYRTYVRLFEEFGIAFDRARFAETYSPEWHRTYSLLGLSSERWAAADARWLELYGDHEASLLPETPASLARLAAAGMRLAVVTSGSRSRVERELSAFGLTSRFAAVVCAEDCARRKPDPEPLTLALHRLGIAPAEAACIGDSPEDVAMSRAAGVFAVGVPGAFPNREALCAAAPDLLAAGLTDAVGRLLAMARNFSASAAAP